MSAIPQNPTSRLRNVGIIAHIDAGKTTLTEAILFHAGQIRKMGSVDAGNTTTDYLAEERERGITITSAAVTVPWNNHQLNLIDTPGHVDFTAEVERSLRVLDGAVVVFCAASGVQVQSEKVWHQADKYRVPRLVFVNKMDRVEGDFWRVVEQVDKMGAHPLLMQLPVGEARGFEGVVDLLKMRVIRFTGEEGTMVGQEIPAGLLDMAEKYRKSLVEAAVESSDPLITRYLAGETLTEQEIREGLRARVVQNQVTPVFCGSAFQNIGIQPLLDGVVELLPSPLDRGTIRGWGVAGQEEIFRRPDLEDPLSALAFKCFRDPYRGPLTFLRVVSGSLTPNTRFLNATTGREERVAGIFRMQADNPQKLTEAGPGEIVAVAGFTGVRTGDTICDPEHPLVFESITFPEPVVHLAVKPKSRTDQGKLGLALNTLMKEDPTFKVTRNPDTEQTIISGMGELHLEVIIHRLASEFGVEVETEAPQVAYKIGISKRVLEVEGRYVKQTGGHGHFARIFIRLELLGGGKGFEFQNAITGGVLPRDYIRAVEKGLLEAVEEDLFAGLPVTGFRVVLFDGQYHPVDSSADDFKKAAIAALKSGIPQAGPVLLEPVMKLEIVVPEENLGAVIADVTRRKGVLQNTKAGMGARIVTAEVPLSETFGYANTLRGVTSGKGFFSMFFSHYARVFAERVPEEIARRMAREIPRT